MADFVDRKMEVVSECGLGDVNQEPAGPVQDLARRQHAGGQTAQQVVELIDDLDGGGGIVHARRERPLSDVDQLAQAKSDVLVHAALSP